MAAAPIDGRFIPRPYSFRNIEITDISARWELAERLVGNDSAPKTALNAVFNRVIGNLERTSRTTIDPSLRQKLWERVSPESLNILKEALLGEFCDQILINFSDAEIKAILQEHKRSGTVNNEVRTAQNTTRTAISRAVEQKANSMSNSLAEFCKAYPAISPELRTVICEEAHPYSSSSSSSAMASQSATSTSPISLNRSSHEAPMSSSRPDNVRDTAIHRQIPHELAEIHAFIIKTKMSDKKTQAILSWHGDFNRAFTASLRSQNVNLPQKVTDEYILLLQQLLRDPISNAPLDELALLGNDGETYSLRSLRIHNSRVPDMYHQTSPLDMENKKNNPPFSTSSHKVVRFMMGWLKKNRGSQDDPNEVALYNDLERQGRLGPVPMAVPDRIRRRMEIERQQEEENSRRRQENDFQFNRVRQESSRAMDEIRASVQGLSPELPQSNSLWWDTYLNDMRRLNNEVDNLEQGNQQLRSQLDQGSGLLSEAERANIELQLAINTTRARIVEGQHASTVNYTSSMGEITGRGDNSRVPEALRHDRIRTQLRAELNEINQVISNTNMNDAMTQQIKSWMDQFYSALSCDLDAEETKTQFISLLRSFFKDALSEMPLDVDARLGRDGQTYALMSLQLNLTSVSNAFRQSSTDPNNRPEFRTTSHLVVKKVAEWLLSRGEILTTEAMRRTFQEQMGSRPLPTIPTDRSERHRRLFEREDAEQPPPNNIEREAAEARARSEREIDAAFAPVINEAREAAANANAELEAHTERMNAQTNRINEEINQLDQEINELEQRNQQLEENLNDNRVLFTEQERRNAELQIRINEVRKQIEEQKKKKLRRLKKTITIVAITIVATLLYPEITLMVSKSGSFLQGGIPF